MTAEPNERVPSQLRVSVVIPSTGREQLARAVNSALRQTWPIAEVIVALNGHSDSPEPAFSDPRVKVISIPDANANAARQAGIRAASGDTIALLDDDDEWEPEKTELQLKLLRQLEPPRPWVVSCGIFITDRTSAIEVLAPRAFAEDHEVKVENYLFRRASLSDSYHQLQTSTLMFPRELGLACEFSSSQKFHQDWTWALDADRIHGARFAVVPRHLVRYVRTSGSITSRTTPLESLEWARRHLSTRRLRGDHCAVVAFNLATERSGLRGATTILRTRVFWHAGPAAIARALFKTAALALGRRTLQSRGAGLADKSQEARRP